MNFQKDNTGQDATRKPWLKKWWPELVVVALLALSVLYHYREQTRQPGFATLSQNQMPSWDWASEPWTGTDVPYRIIQNVINTEVAHATPEQRGMQVERYRTAALKKPKDALAQFAWAHAAFRSGQLGYEFSEHSSGVAHDISLMLAAAPSPHCRQYDRMRFLAAVGWRRFPELVGLGERLMERHPRDYEVKYFLVYLLAEGDTQEQAKAIGYALEMVRKAPHWTSSYVALGSAYYGKFRRTRDPIMGDKAISAWRKYLEVAPSDDFRREELKKFISIIEATKNQAAIEEG